MAGQGQWTADATDEDAAYLQFPKERPLSTPRELKPISPFVDSDAYSSDRLCLHCHTLLSEPYVHCAICRDVDLCAPCFAQGAEAREHQNHHDYVIVRNEFELVPNSDWSAKQEVQLLDLLRRCGYGNWSAISKRMDKTPEDCKRHYLEHYINKQSLPGLPKFQDNRDLVGEPVPYCFKLQDSEEPPRFAPSSANWRLLAGYNPARADFEINFDNHAELLIANLKFDEFKGQDRLRELGEQLQVALLSSYNIRLKERFRRRRIIREHGLMAFRKNVTDLHRYDSTIGRAISERMLIFMQLTKGIDFDYVMEGLHLAGELKQRINKLLEFRANGLRSFFSVGMYQKLSKMRMEYEKDRKIYLNSSDYCWKAMQPESGAPVSTVAPPGGSQRKPPPPLQIQGLPMYEKLSGEERELCSVLRLSPINYLEYRHQLMVENKKCGTLKLAQARNMLKIDVNKTRKIYDFLVEHGYIVKPPS